ADTLCFQLGGARRMMTWRQFILALGLHTEEDMAEAGFGAYSQGSERVCHMRRLCHMMIACSISGRGQAPAKVTGVDLFYLRSIDRGTANVPYLLAQYLFRHAEGRKSGARLSRGHFIGRLAAHFGLVSDQGLRGLSVASRPERQPKAAAGAPGAAEDAHAADEVLMLIQHSCRHLSCRHLPPRLFSRGSLGSRRRCRSCEGAL
ncbi:hypothetical protein Tco_1425072, partial [Tanacetum coccineum]